jgi:hypothetical protein
VSAAALAAIDRDGIAGVGRRQGRAEPVLACRDEDEMDMVWHQAPGPDRSAALPAEAPQEGEVEGVVVFAEEDALAAIAALGDVVGQSRQDLAGGSRHSGRLTGKRKLSQII